MSKRTLLFIIGSAVLFLTVLGAPAPKAPMPVAPPTSTPSATPTSPNMWDGGFGSDIFKLAPKASNSSTPINPSSSPTGGAVGEPQPPSEPRPGDENFIERRVLVVHDGGANRRVGRLHAQIVAKELEDHNVEVIESSNYRPGLALAAELTVYLGVTYDAALPPAFLNDVYQTKGQVIWLNYNIWQLSAHPEFEERYGWNWAGLRRDQVRAVEFNGEVFERDVENSEIMDYAQLDPKVEVVAVAQGRTEFPWAVRSENLTYIGENPLVSSREDDRSAIFKELLQTAVSSS